MISWREFVANLFDGGLLCLLLAFVLLMSLIGCASTPACEGNWEASDGQPHGWQPNMDRAQIEVIPWTIGEDRSVIAWVSEWTCCDCGLVHRMAFVPTADGLVIYVWRLDRETRRERARRGMLQQIENDTWLAESPGTK